LRDEFGRTAYGHREVAVILKSLVEWMTSSIRNDPSDTSENSEPRDDPEMAPIYLKFFLPVFSEDLFLVCDCNKAIKCMIH